MQGNASYARLRPAKQYRLNQLDTAIQVIPREYLAIGNLPKHSGRHREIFLRGSEDGSHPLFFLPRMAEHAIATSPMIPARKKVKFIALTNTEGCAGVGVADGSPL